MRLEDAKGAKVAVNLLLLVESTLSVSLWQLCKRERNWVGNLRSLLNIGMMFIRLEQTGTSLEAFGDNTGKLAYC